MRGLFVKGGRTAMHKVVMMGLMGFVGLMWLSGCRTNERVVEVIKTDTLIVKDMQRDSIYVEREKHDSVYIHQNGDTMWVEKWHTEWRDRWRDRETHDTIYQSKTDTVRVKEVVAGKASTITKWQKLRMTLGDIALIVMLFILLLYVVRYVIMKVVRP